MSIKALQYCGLGPMSIGIKVQTRSPHSHTALQFPDGRILEAWGSGGERFWHGSVRWIENPWDGHKIGTPVDVYRIEGFIDVDKALEFAEEQIGKRYDFLSVLRFVSRRKAPANDRWFCSELAMATLAAGELDILHGNPAHMSPRDIDLSPLLHYEKTL